MRARRGSNGRDGVQARVLALHGHARDAELKRQYEETRMGAQQVPLNCFAPRAQHIS